MAVPLPEGDLHVQFGRAKHEDGDQVPHNPKAGQHRDQDSVEHDRQVVDRRHSCIKQVSILSGVTHG
jgi:hypothetical protein